MHGTSQSQEFAVAMERATVLATRSKEAMIYDKKSPHADNLYVDLEASSSIELKTESSHIC